MKIVLPMAKIQIENLFRKTLEVSDQNKTILQHFHDNHIDWMHACGAKGRCTTCKIEVKAGLESLGQLSEAEKKYFQQNLLKSNERLSCQVKISGDVIVCAPHEYKLPHIHYSD